MSGSVPNMIWEKVCKKDPPPGICKNCVYFVKRSRLLWDAKICWEYCWKREIDKRRKHPKMGDEPC